MPEQAARRADVVVVGAGSAGVAAAVAAAESGARTELIEASGEVGGTLAWQLLEHSAGFHDVAGEQVVGGVGQRIVDRLRQYGASPGHIADDVGYTASRTPLNHAELAMAEALLLDDAGVRLSLHSPVVAADVEGGSIRAVEVETRAGRERIEAGAYVDASGDAALAALAGADFHRDGAGRLQPASLLLKLGGVRLAELLGYAREHPEELRPGSIVGEAAREHVNLWGFGSLLRSGHRAGLLSFERAEMHLAGWPRRGEAVLNVTRARWNGAAAEGETYLSLGRQVLEVVHWFRRTVPGGSDAYLAAVADRIGVRESRRVLGLDTLTRDDVLGGRRHRTSVATGAFPIDIHDSTSASMAHAEQATSSYDIPYGCLVAAGPSNLLVAGRCVSSTHEANGSVRITATCFATGEAAGVAAAVAGRDGCEAAGVPVGRLQEVLRSRGALGARDGLARRR